MRRLQSVSWYHIVLVISALLLLFGVSAWAQSVSIQPTAQSSTTAQVTCGVASATLLAANTRRRDSIFVAESTNTATISINPAATAVTTTGIPLTAGVVARDNSYVGVWSCISTAAGQLIRVTETAR